MRCDTHIKRSSPAFVDSVIRVKAKTGQKMASKTVLTFFISYLLALALCAPAQDLKVENEKEDLQTAASHWGGFGHYGGYGHYGHYYPHYGYGYGYGLGWPGYGYYYGGYPYGYYGHGYWW